MTQFALIADDLTGANDSGVQFVRHGFGASVFFAGQPVRSGTEVLVLDTDTRGRPAREAYKATRRAAERLAAIEPAVVYKKVDSTLRGNLAAEIDAAMDAFGFGVALIAPAFPRIGRTTQGAIQYLHGTPVHETEIARDPKAPVLTADIAELMTAGSERKVGRLALAEVQDGQATQRLQQLRDEGAQLIVCDAATEADLVAVALAGRALGEPVLYVGSAGLADVLPGALGIQPSAGAGSRVGQDLMVGPILLAVGSVSSVSRGQLARVLAQPSAVGVEVCTESLMGDRAAEEEARAFTEGMRALMGGRDLALYSAVADDAVRRTQALGRERGLSPVQTSEQVAAALGRIAGRLCREAVVGGLVLTGGDTAQAVCREIGATGIDLIREVEPGIPLGRLVGERPYGAVTKAGAFGTENALWLAMESLKGVPAGD